MGILSFLNRHFGADSEVMQLNRELMATKEPEVEKPKEKVEAPPVAVVRPRVLRYRLKKADNNGTLEIEYSTKPLLKFEHELTSIESQEAFDKLISAIVDSNHGDFARTQHHERMGCINMMPNRWLSRSVIPEQPDWEKLIQIADKRLLDREFQKNSIFTISITQALVELSEDADLQSQALTVEYAADGDISNTKIGNHQRYRMTSGRASDMWTIQMTEEVQQAAKAFYTTLPSRFETKFVVGYTPPPYRKHDRKHVRYPKEITSPEGRALYDRMIGRCVRKSLSGPRFKGTIKWDNGSTTVFLK